MSGKNNFVKIAYVFRIFNLWMIMRFFVFDFLGLGYISKALKMWGVEFDLVDCTLIILAIEGVDEPKDYSLIRHILLSDSGFSENNLKDAIGKAQAQFYG